MSAPHMPMMNDEGLLECPFCGCDKVELTGDDEGWAFIQCDKCYCRTDGFRNPRLMIDTWNTRNGYIYTAEDFNQAAQERE